MAQPKPFPLPISYGHTKAVKNSGGFLINMEAEKAPDDARTPVTLNGSPGLRLFADTGTDPVLEMIEINNLCYAVTQAGFFRVFPDGGTYHLGTVNMEPVCSLATNGLDVVMTDGRRAFRYHIDAVNEQIWYDTQVPFVNRVVEMTNEPNFHPASTATFLDQLLIFGRDGTNQVFNTGVLTTAIDPLAFRSAESNPDFVTAVMENQQQLFVIGRRTFEVWYNSGVGVSPFRPIEGATGDHGTESPYTVAKIRNTAMWLDQNKVVVMVSGYQPRPISTIAIEDELAKRDATFAKAFTYSENGHDYYQLSVQDFTAVYDLSTGLWHVREDYDLIRHRASCHAFAYKKNLVGSVADGKIYEMSSGIYDNDGRPLVAKIVVGPIDTGGRKVKYPSFEIVMDTGVANAACPEPKIGLEISNDDGKTWGNQRLLNMGRTGNYIRRLRWQRNGQSEWRRWRLVISDPVRRSLTTRCWIGMA